jgi:nucleoside-diphosphate-sugar epimerase
MFIIYGASGFIGRALQAALTARKVPYVGFSRLTCIISRDGSTPEVAEAKSPADRASLLKTFSAPRAAIFVAGAAVATTDPEILRASHLDSLRQAFESLQQKWWERLPLVYASSGLVYGRRVSPRPIRESEPTAPNSTYGEIKLKCEELLTKLAVRTGARSVAARLFNVTGPGHSNGIVPDVAHQAADILSGVRADFRLRSNTPFLDLIHVREAAEGLIRLAEVNAPPPIVNVCSGRMLTTNDLINAARQVIGRDCPVSYEDSGGPCEALIGSPDLMTAMTGWSARMSVDQIVRDVILSVQKGKGAADG